MAWTKVDEVSTALADGTGTENVSFGVTLQEGDIVVAAQAHDSGNPATLTGYTQIKNETSNSIGCLICYKVMGATPDTSIDFNKVSNIGFGIGAGIAQVWRGGDTTTVEDVTATSFATASGTTADPPSITTVTDGALVIAFGFLDDEGPAATVSSYSSGYTNGFFQAGATTTGSSVGMCSKEVTTAGAENPGVITFGQSDATAAVTIALRPAAAGTDVDLALGTYTLSGKAITIVPPTPASNAGKRFVRRQNAARGTTSNTTAADITYDTAVFAEEIYTWSSPEVTVSETGKYLTIFDLGQVDLASTRAVGTLVPAINGTQQERFRARHRYLRNSGGDEGTSIGMAILDLTASDDVKARNPGVLTPTDALGSYATRVSYGGALQLIRLPDDTNFTHVERTVDAAEVGTSNINTTRPWIDSSGTWTTVTFNSEVADTGGYYSGSGGDITLPANGKFMIVWGITSYSTDASRHSYVARLRINNVNVQSGSSYQRNTASQGPPICGMYLHETGVSSETLNLQATHEIEGGDAGTPNVSDAYVQVFELNDSAEWIHVDNGTTDSLTTALAGTSTYYDTPLSSTFRADGDSNLSLDGTNNAVQNDSGGTLPVLAIGWHRWDRDSTVSGTRKMPWGVFDNNGTKVGYGIAGAYSRGQQSTDDTWQSHYTSVATMDLANAADLSFQANEPASAANSDMGVYASTNRHFLGLQVLNLESLVEATASTTDVDLALGTYTLAGNAIDVDVTTEVDLDAGTYGFTGNAVTITVQDVTDVDLDAGSYAFAGYDIGISVIDVTAVDLDAGSYSLAGNAITIDVINVTDVDLDAGAYSFAGQDLTINLVNVTDVDLNTGAYTLAGHDLTIGITDVTDVNLALGTYALAGQTLTIDVINVTDVDLDQGSYAFAGQTLNISVTDVTDVDLAVGSYSFAGQDLTITVQDVTDVNLAQGSYSLAGNDLTIGFDRSVDLDTGTYSFGGYDIGITTGIDVDLDAGAYTFAGQDLTAALTRAIDLDSGSYSLAGSNLDITTDTAFNLDAGAYTLAGGDVDITEGNNIPLQRGLYTFAGYDLDITVSSNVNLDAGTYSVAGNDIDIAEGVTVNLDAGVYNFEGFQLTVIEGGAEERSRGAGSTGDSDRKRRDRQSLDALNEKRRKEVLEELKKLERKKKQTKAPKRSRKATKLKRLEEQAKGLLTEGYVPSVKIANELTEFVAKDYDMDRHFKLLLWLINERNEEEAELLLLLAS